MKRFIINAAIALLTALLLFFGYHLYQYLSTEKQVEKEFEDLVEQVETPQSPDETNQPEEPEWTVFDQYQALFEQNADMVGWISIEGTTISYPVMHTPDRPDYYLKHNFEKAYSDAGVPYVDNNCSMDPRSDNLIIYGHHMKSGKMFGALESYKKVEFFREHPIIQFDTFTDGFGQYEIFAVFKVNPADFKFHHFINATDEDTFDEYVNRCKSLSFYDTGITPTYGDKLIALSTCEYSREGNRLVVVAKKIQ